MGLFFTKQNNNIIEEVKDFLRNELVISKQACGRSEKSWRTLLLLNYQRDLEKIQCIDSVASERVLK